MSEQASAAAAEEGGRSSGVGLLVAAAGVVYGDIGTSPLYTLKEVFAGHYGVQVNHDGVFGILSLIVWSLLWVVTLKYVMLMLRADNEGEGGVMALTALARRAALPYPRLKTVLVLLGLFGAALFYGDSMITPAISVLSATEGLQYIVPGFKPWIVPTAVAILFGLFAIQSRGTAKVGMLFGPIMLAYFTMLAILGLIHIVDHPGIILETLKAATDELADRLGPDPHSWAWGRLHVAKWEPAVAVLADPQLRAQMTLGPLATPGSASTPRAQTYRATDFNVTAGASVVSRVAIATPAAISAFIACAKRNCDTCGVMMLAIACGLDIASITACGVWPRPSMP